MHVQNISKDKNFRGGNAAVQKLPLFSISAGIPPSGCALQQNEQSISDSRKSYNRMTLTLAEFLCLLPAYLRHIRQLFFPLPHFIENK